MYAVSDSGALTLAVIAVLTIVMLTALVWKHDDNLADHEHRLRVLDARDHAALVCRAVE